MTDSAALARELAEYPVDSFQTRITFGMTCWEHKAAILRALCVQAKFEEEKVDCGAGRLQMIMEIEEGADELLAELGVAK